MVDIDVDRLERMIRATVRKEIRSLDRRTNGAISRAVLGSLASDEGTALAGAALRDGDEDSDLELFEQYGFTSAPLAGAEGVGLTVGGDSSHRVLVCVGDRRHRPTDLEAGEVAVYRNAAGHRILLKADGAVEVRAADEAGAVIELRADGNVVVTPGPGGKVLAGGEGASSAVSLADYVDDRIATLQAAFDGHVHPGVTVGMGSTAVTPSIVGPLAPTGATKVNAE